MFNMFLDVCKNTRDYIRKLWISRGGGSIEIRGGIGSCIQNTYHIIRTSLLVSMPPAFMLGVERIYEYCTQLYALFEWDSYYHRYRR